MSMLDRLITIVNDQGWLAISSLYFDNNMVIEICNSYGAIAYSQADDCFYTYNAVDQGYTEIIEGKLIVFDNSHIGQQQVLTCVGTEHMQHFDIAQFTHYGSYPDKTDKFPFPTVPAPTDLDQYTLNTETGLYEGPKATIAHMKDNTDISVIPFFDKNTQWYESAARIEYWKKFQENHQKFLDFLDDGYGISAI